MFNFILLAQSADQLPKMPTGGDVAGAASLVIVILYIVFQFIMKFVESQKSGQKDQKEKTSADNAKEELKDEITKLWEEAVKLDDKIVSSIACFNKELSETNKQIAVILAHHQSDERVRNNLEALVSKLEKVLLSGNGLPPLLTRVAILENDINDMRKEIERKSKSGTR